MALGREFQEEEPSYEEGRRLMDGGALNEDGGLAAVPDNFEEEVDTVSSEEEMREVPLVAPEIHSSDQIPSETPAQKSQEVMNKLKMGMGQIFNREKTAQLLEKSKTSWV